MELSPSPTKNDPLQAVMTAILAQPQFEAAVELYVAHIAAWRREMGIFNRVATTSGLHAIGYLSFLHYANTSGRPETGATFSRILEICESRCTCGSRALRTVLALSQLMGYVGVERSRTDRRIKAYIPTEKLIVQSRNQFAYAFACLDLLVPGATFASDASTDPAFLPKVLGTSGKAFLDHDLAITEFFPDMQALLELQGGCPVYTTIVDAVIHGREIPPANAIAKDFHISPSQVRTVLKTAADRRLITLSDRGQILDASPLVAQQKAMIARELALYAKYSLGLEPYFCSVDSRAYASSQ